VSFPSRIHPFPDCPPSSHRTFLIDSRASFWLRIICCISISRLHGILPLKFKFTKTEIRDKAFGIARSKNIHNQCKVQGDLDLLKKTGELFGKQPVFAQKSISPPME